MRPGIAERTLRALDARLSRVPGGSIHTDIGTAALLSSICGSSAAAATAVATVATPQAERPGCDPRPSSGVIAAGGTLDIAIPPSIDLMLHDFPTEISAPRLFPAGPAPGALLALPLMAAGRDACAGSSTQPL